MSAKKNVLKIGKGDSSTIKQVEFLFRSCLGIIGESVMILDCEDGIIATTSRSSFLLQHLQTEDVTAKLIINMCKSFITGNYDLGGTLMYLTIDIILRMQQLETTPTNSIQQYLKRVKEVVNESIHAIKIPMSLANLSDFKSLIYTVANPKLKNYTSQDEIGVFISVILESFLSSITTTRYPDIKILKHFGPTLTDSKFYNGLLIPHKHLKNCSDIKIALFSCSIPQELDALEGETVKFVNYDTTVEKEFVEQTKKNLELFLSKCSVQMICSQKTIHQEIKSFLESNGILCMERLSLIYSQEAADLAKTTLLPTLNVFGYGVLEKVNNVKIGNKSYVQLVPKGESHYGTIVLCGQTESTMNECEAVAQTSLQICRSAISARYLVPGASCLYSSIICALQEISTDSPLKLCPEQCFIAGLKEISAQCSLGDELWSNVTGHCWSYPGDRDPTFTGLCECRSYRSMTSSRFTQTTGPSLTDSSQSWRLLGDPLYNAHKSSFVPQSDIRVLHPLSTVTNMFEKLFQILDIYFQSEPFHDVRTRGGITL